MHIHPAMSVYKRFTIIKFHCCNWIHFNLCAVASNLIAGSECDGIILFLCCHTIGAVNWIHFKLCVELQLVKSLDPNVME